MRLIAAHTKATPSLEKQFPTAAILSPCRLYRYSLTREWGGGKAVLFVGLNPSTANETQDDPTIRRCIAFAREWGYSRLHMANLFAFRATEPRAMMNASDPIGPDNDMHLLALADNSALTVAAWGIHGKHVDRHIKVRMMLPRLHYLRLTKHGYPSHPLYLPKTLRPIEWTHEC